jgi:hypothetical protein
MLSLAITLIFASRQLSGCKKLKVVLHKLLKNPYLCALNLVIHDFSRCDYSRVQRFRPV